MRSMARLRLVDAASYNGVASTFMQSGSRGYAAAQGKESGGAASAQTAKPKLLGGRYGSRLRRAGKADDFTRMSTILGFGQPLGQATGKVEKVTISTLQTMKYLQLPLGFKQSLAAYRVAALGRDLEPLLQKTSAFLQEDTAASPSRSKGSSKR